MYKQMRTYQQASYVILSIASTSTEILTLNNNNAIKYQ